MPDQREATAIFEHRPRRRLRRWITLMLVLLPALWVGRYVYLHLTLHPTPRREYWEAQAAALDPPPPGAASSLRMHALLAHPPWNTYPALTANEKFYPGLLLDGSWDKSRWDIAAARRCDDSGSYDAWWSEVLQAVATGWEDPPMIDLMSLDATANTRRNIAIWLLFRSRRALEEQNDRDLAVACWLDALRMGRQLRRQQTSLALLMESASTLFTAHEMMLAARKGLGFADQSTALRQVKDFIGRPRGPIELTRGERIRAEFWLEVMYIREGGQWLDVSETSRIYAVAMGHTWGASTAPQSTRCWNLTAPLFHDLPYARGVLERSWTEIAKCHNLVLCRQVTTKAEASRDLQLTALDGFPAETGGWSWVSEGAHMVQMHYMAMCAMDAALTMLALNRYQADRYCYPESLADLVPKYLDRLPVDYADLKPLRYRRTDDGYVLYSIGADGQDNGGRSVDNKGYLAKAFDIPDSDVVFSAVEREEQ